MRLRYNGKSRKELTTKPIGISPKNIDSYIAAYLSANLDSLIASYLGNFSRVVMFLGDTTYCKLPDATNTKYPLTYAQFDYLNECIVSKLSQATIGTGGTTLCDSSAPFVSGDVGDTVWNPTTGETTTIASFTSTSEVELTADISLSSGSDYFFREPKFVAQNDGMYLIYNCITFLSMPDSKRILNYIHKNGGVFAGLNNNTSFGNTCISVNSAGLIDLDADDYLSVSTYHLSTVPEEIRYGKQWTCLIIARIN